MHSRCRSQGVPDVNVNSPEVEGYVCKPPLRGMGRRVNAQCISMSDITGLSSRSSKTTFVKWAFRRLTR